MRKLSRILMLSLAMTALVACEETGNLEVQNLTGTLIINELNILPPSSASWSGNQLSSDIYPGNSRTISNLECGINYVVAYETTMTYQWGPAPINIPCGDTFVLKLY